MTEAEDAAKWRAAVAEGRVVPEGWRIAVRWYPTNDGQRHALATLEPVLPDDGAPFRVGPVTDKEAGR